MRRPAIFYGTLLAAAAAVGAIAINGQSLWIDEGTSAVKATQPTLQGWWRALRIDGSSNLQLPLHYLYLWIWEKIFGASEIALRAANIPPLAFGYIAIAWGLEARPRYAFWFIVLASINAFTWYYANEARPYLLLFACCCGTFACLARARFGPRRCIEDRAWFLILLGSSLMVSAGSSIAAPWAMTTVAGSAFLLGKDRFVALVRRDLFWSCAWCVLISCLGAYYLWTISLGAVPTSIGRTGISNLAFVLYEQLGLAGLGPGRLKLREGGLASFAPYVPGLAVASLALLAVLDGTRQFLARHWTRMKLPLWIGFLVVLPSAAILIAARAGQARLLGRHFTPLYPFLLFGLAVGVDQLLRKKTVSGKVIAGAFLCALLFSSLQIRFAARHEKDDYRSATAEALRLIHQDGFVWWAADKATGDYYQLPASESASPSLALHCPSADDLVNLPEPGMIVRSKPDVYDSHGAILDYARTHGFHLTHSFQAFEIWEKP